MSKTYRSDVDGLRALAVTAVVFYHAGLPWLAGGFVGVDVFYVISGFLITGLIHPDIAAQKFSFARFYARRTKRILPALFLILLVTCGLACLLLGPAELTSFARSAVAATFGLSNVYYYSSSNYFTEAAAYQPLLMTWSLGVEEQFYLVYPMLLMLLARLSRPRQLLALTAITLISLGLSIWSTQTHPTAAFYLLPSRAWELGIGCLLALSWDEMQVLMQRRYLADGLGVAGALMVLAAIACFGGTTDFPGWAALLPVTGTAFLVATPSGLVNRLLLSSRPAVFVGLLSYSWYLWHWPLMSFARIASSRPLGPAVPSLLALLALAAAYASWRWVERPFRASRSADAVVLVRNAGIGAGVAAIAAVFALTQGLPARFSARERAEASSATALASDPCLVLVGGAPNRSPACMPRDNGTPAMALIGDSHAAVFRQTLAANTAGRYRLLALLKSSCAPLLGVALYMPKNPAFRQDCLAFMRDAFDAVAADREVSTVLLAGYWSLPFDAENAGLRLVRAGEAPTAATPGDSRANLAVGLAAALNELAAAGKHVILIEDPPGLRFNPLRQLMADAIGPRGRLSDAIAGEFPRSGGLVARTAMTSSDGYTASVLRRAAVAYPGVEILDPSQALCAGDLCRYADGEGLLYSDERHLTNAGARRVLASLPAGFAASGDAPPSNHAERP